MRPSGILFLQEGLTDIPICAIIQTVEQLFNCKGGEMSVIEKEVAPLCDSHELHRDEIEKSREGMPCEERITSLSDLFKVLGDPTRLRILFAIEGGALCVCDVAELLGMTKSAVSHQLKILRTSALVSCRRVGKNVFYELADAHVKDIIDEALVHTGCDVLRIN